MAVEKVAWVYENYENHSLYFIRIINMYPYAPRHTLITEWQKLGIPMNWLFKFFTISYCFSHLKSIRQWSQADSNSETETLLFWQNLFIVVLNLLFQLTFTDKLLELTKPDTIIYCTQIKILDLRERHEGIGVKITLLHTILASVKPVFCANSLM